MKSEKFGEPTPDSEAEPVKKKDMSRREFLIDGAMMLGSMAVSVPVAWEGAKYLSKKEEEAEKKMEISAEATITNIESLQEEGAGVTFRPTRKNIYFSINGKTELAIVPEDEYSARGFDVLKVGEQVNLKYVKYADDTVKIRHIIVPSEY